jgi:uncharacterized C2H2 Zn-finger protein
LICLQCAPPCPQWRDERDEKAAREVFAKTPVAEEYDKKMKTYLDVVNRANGVKVPKEKKEEKKEAVKKGFGGTP